MAIRQGATANWIKSSYSANGACVEVKSPVMEAIAVRDSKAQDGPSLTFAPDSWTSFVTGVTEGGWDASPEQHGASQPVSLSVPPLPFGPRVRHQRARLLHHSQHLHHTHHPQYPRH